MIDPFQNIRDYITDRVLFSIMFLTYNWNKIICKLPSAHISKNMGNKSLMQPLYMLNAIEIHEAGRGNSEATVHYGLNCACCKQFITNSDRFTASISKLVDLLQIAVGVHYGTFYSIRQKIDSQNNNSSPQLTYTCMCFDPAIYKKAHTMYSLKTLSLSNVML